MIILHKILLVTFLSCVFFLNSCGIYKKTDARKIPTNANERVEKNMQEGKGFRLGNLGKNSGGTTFQFASSNPLWRATLEKLDFAPLSNVDYAGGVIITDWFSQDNSGEHIKITVRFLTNEIRSDAIDIIVHKKNCTTQNNCTINKIENTFNNQIKIAILQKAAQIQKKDLVKKKEGSKPVKLPKNY